MVTYTLEEWKQAATERFGTPDYKQWKFKCPNCGHVQTLQDFLDLGLEPEEAHKVFYFSCIGRWKKDETPGTIFDKKQPCNYTLGGLFKLNKVQVVGEDGEPVPVFEFAEPENVEAVK